MQWTFYTSFVTELFCENAAAEHVSYSLSATSSFCALLHKVFCRNAAGFISISRIYRPQRNVGGLKFKCNQA